MKKLLIFAMLLASGAIHAQSYNVFQPGGVLCGVWNVQCLNANVVTLANMATLTADSVIGNNTGTAATPAPLNPLAAANLMSAVFSAQAAGTSNIVLSGAQTIDGVALVAGQSVFLSGQTTHSQNGLWIVQSGAWTRAVNWPSGYVINPNCNIAVFIIAGSSNKGHTYSLATTAAITIDTTGETWADSSIAGGGGGGTPGGAANTVQYNNSGSFGGIGPGTTTTVLHGNASGAGTYGSVNYATDGTGNLPVTNLNGGTSASATTVWTGDGSWKSTTPPQTVNWGVGFLSSINTNKSTYTKFFKASTVQNITGSALSYSCATPPTVTMYECGTSTTCASPTTIGTVTITALGTAYSGTVSNPAITAGDYVAFAFSAGTCAGGIDAQVAAQVTAN